MKKLTELHSPVKSMDLKNKVHIKFYDLSKTIAADRWFVRVCCEVETPFNEDFLLHLEEDAALLDSFRASCGDTLSMQVVKERNFVDETVKDDVVTQLIEQIEQNSVEYLGAESFPHKLFLSNFGEFKKTHLLCQTVDVNTDLDEDEGPADFSACFKD